MKKFRVKMKPETNYFYMTVKAKNKKQAMEEAENQFMDGHVEIEDEYLDPSDVDTATAIEAEEIK